MTITMWLWTILLPLGIAGVIFLILRFIVLPTIHAAVDFEASITQFESVHGKAYAESLMSDYSPAFPVPLDHLSSLSPSSASDSDYGIPLGTLQQEALELSIAKGFDESDAAERLAFAMVEVGEAIQALRGHSVTDIWFSVDSEGIQKPEGVVIEIADAFIRLAGFAQFHGLDISKGIRLKMPYNWRRKYGYGKIKMSEKGEGGKGE